jgi:hypothetical protein
VVLEPEQPPNAASAPTATTTKKHGRLNVTEDQPSRDPSGGGGREALRIRNLLANLRDRARAPDRYLRHVHQVL